MFTGLRKGQIYVVYMAVYSSEGLNPLFARARKVFDCVFEDTKRELIAGLLMFMFVHYGSGRL